jgi:hypothetical protein
MFSGCGRNMQNSLKMACVMTINTGKALARCLNMKLHKIWNSLLPTCICKEKNTQYFISNYNGRVQRNLLTRVLHFKLQWKGTKEFVGSGLFTDTHRQHCLGLPVLLLHHLGPSTDLHLQ